MNKPKLAIVWWYDAYSADGGNQIQKNPKDRGVPTISVGHLVERSKFGIRLATIRHDDRDRYCHRSEHFIPAGMISKVKLRNI